MAAVWLSIVELNGCIQFEHNILDSEIPEDVRTQLDREGNIYEEEEEEELCV